MSWPFRLGLIALLACSSEPTTDLRVDLKTDLQPGFEIDEYEISVQAGDDARLLRGPIDVGVDWIAGERLAVVDGLPRGPLPLQITLFHESAEVVSRPVRVDLEGQRFAVTVMITRDCRGVECPAPMGDPTASACLAGSCADPRCVEEALASCPMPECEVDADCVADSPCAIPRCSVGRCYFGAMACEDGQRCDPDVGCVRIDGSSMVEAMRIVAATTSVPAGDLVRLQVTFDPPESQVPGEQVRLRTDAGMLEIGGMRAADVPVEADVDGAIPEVFLDVPLGLVEGASISLTASVPATGDTAFAVLAPTLRTQMVDGDAYDVAGQLVIENPLLNDPSATLTDRAGVDGMIVPLPGSGFGGDVYVATNDPPEIHRVVDGQLTLFTTSPGDPDENVSPIAFSMPTGPYGDFLYACSASVGGGDGLYRVTPDGTWETWVDDNNCNGLAFDRSNAFGDPGWTDVLYTNWNAQEMRRVSPATVQDVLVNDLPFRGSGYKLFAPDSPAFVGSLFMVSPADDMAASDGVVQVTSQLDPWVSPTSVGGFGDPATLAFPTGAPFGDIALLLLRDGGDLFGLRPDYTSFTIVSGLDQPVSMALASDGSLWIAQRSGTMRRIVGP